MSLTAPAARVTSTPATRGIEASHPSHPSPPFCLHFPFVISNKESPQIPPSPSSESPLFSSTFLSSPHPLMHPFFHPSPIRRVSDPLLDRRDSLACRSAGARVSPSAHAGHMRTPETGPPEDEGRRPAGGGRRASSAGRLVPSAADEVLAAFCFFFLQRH